MARIDPANPSQARPGPLHNLYGPAGARFTELAGLPVPQDYGDARAEAEEVRRRAGIFDISHLGRIRIRGDGAMDLLELVCNADVAHMEDDTVRPVVICGGRGNPIDRCVLFRLEDYWLVTTSADKRAAVLEELAGLAGEFAAKVDDQTAGTVHLAICGPAAPVLLDAVLPEKVSAMKRGQVKTGSMLIARYIAARVGMTRLWSLEVILPTMLAGRAWTYITQKAGANCIKPAGLTAREILYAQLGPVDDGLGQNA